MLLIRDPRDILASAYFSEAFSHTLMPGEAGAWQQANRTAVRRLSINCFVIQRAPDILQRFDSYRPLLTNPGTRLFRYEDVVYSKEEWIEEMLDHLDLSLDRARVRKIVPLVDHRPPVEDPAAHVRQVKPGDHRAKLRPSTIAALDSVFRDVLSRFEYPRQAFSEVDLAEARRTMTHAASKKVP